MCEAFHKTRHEASGVDARDVRGGKRIRVQGAQAVFRQAILRVKTRRSRARLLAASPVSRRCLALGKSAGCKCGGYRGRKLTAPHAKGCGGKATHRPPDVNLRPRAGTFRRNPSQTERTVTPKSDATRTAHSPSPDYISPSHPRLCHIITFQRNKIAPVARIPDTHNSLNFGITRVCQLAE